MGRGRSRAKDGDCCKATSQGSLAGMLPHADLSCRQPVSARRSAGTHHDGAIGHKVGAELGVADVAQPSHKHLARGLVAALALWREWQAGAQAVWKVARTQVAGAPLVCLRPAAASRRAELQPCTPCTQVQA